MNLDMDAVWDATVLVTAVVLAIPLVMRLLGRPLGSFFAPKCDTCAKAASCKTGACAPLPEPKDGSLKKQD
ncbi:MAG: hypothetical protein HQL36_08490 [Alphaproteobacteria bacterium]|nr:hypothetical protein [Alphaproteobacteria bacterium]MBF0251702.1 hypothetical protein [Alphaproteobacteria bacterium]